MRHLTLAMVTALALAPFAAQAQDATAGQRVFNQCRACHTIDAGGRNGVGPNLHGIVGRAAGSIEGFRYSANMQEWRTGQTWSEENSPPLPRQPEGSPAARQHVLPGHPERAAAE